MMNNDETQEEKTVVIGYEEDTGLSGEIPNNDPWASALAATPAPGPSSASSSTNQRSFPTRHQRFSLAKIAAFAAVVVFVVVAGLGFYAFAAAAGHHAAPVVSTAQKQQAQPAPAPALMPTPTLASVAKTAPAPAKAQQAAMPKQQPQNNDNPAAPTTTQDTFQRDATASWGTIGNQKWKIIGDKQAFSIVNGTGLIVPQNNDAAFYTATLGPTSSTTVDVTCTFTMQKFTFPQSNVGLVLRWQDNNNYYKAYINGEQLVLMKNVAGQQTTIRVMKFAAQAGTAYTIRFRIEAGDLMTHAWQADRPEPALWLKAQDTDLSTGKAGIRALLLPGDSVQVSSFRLVA